MNAKNVRSSFILIFAFFGWCTFYQEVFGQSPTITVRFANPQNDCVTGEYCLDVEFKCDTSDLELFGMNVRFFYDDDVLEFVDFRDYQGGYGSIPPDPPIIFTSATAGPAMFNFNGPAEFINGAIQLVNSSAPPLYLDTINWTKIFQICFLVDDPNANLDTFCPSVVWDLEQDPENGGFLAGDDGVVMTIVDPDPDNESLPVTENVDQFNWEYIGDGDPPFGIPVDSTCSNINCFLPVTFLSFTGKAVELGNEMDWKTVNEINVVGFDVQRSLDGLNWYTLDFVPGSGTSIELHHYKFLDANIISGATFYRLLQKDVDGRTLLSPIIRIDRSKLQGHDPFKVYPNPATNGITTVYLPLDPSEESLWRLISPTGELLKEALITESNFSIDLRGWPSGIYIISVVTHQGILNEKLMIIQPQ